MKPQTYWFPSTVPNRLPSPFFTLITTPSHKNLRHIRETPPVDNGCKLGGSSYGWSFTTCGRGWVQYWAWLRHGCGLVLCDCEDHRMVVIAIFWLWQRFYSIVLVPTLKINKWTSWCVLRITSVQPSVQSDHSMRYRYSSDKQWPWNSHDWLSSSMKVLIKFLVFPRLFLRRNYYT